MPSGTSSAPPNPWKPASSSSTTTRATSLTPSARASRTCRQGTSAAHGLKHQPARSGPVGVGIIGAGIISKQYLDNLTIFPDLKVHAIGRPLRGRRRRSRRGIRHRRPGGVDAALNHPDVEIVVNLTIPAAHVEVATAAVNAGKHVWSEKPFSLDRESGRGLLKAADAAGVRLGCAPDTFLGAGLQTRPPDDRTRRYRHAADRHDPFQSPGPESWHPNPAFLFQYGAGPAVRHGPVLPHRPGPDVRLRPPGGGLRLQVPAKSA